MKKKHKVMHGYWIDTLGKCKSYCGKNFYDLDYVKITHDARKIECKGCQNVILKGWEKKKRYERMVGKNPSKGV